MPLVNCKPPARLTALSDPVSILVEGLLPLRKVFEVKAAGERAQRVWTPPSMPSFKAPPGGAQSWLRVPSVRPV